MTERKRGGRSDEEVREQDERTFAECGAVEDDDTDVVLDVPVLNIEELDLEVEELHAHISARAELAGFLNIAVGVDAHVDKVKLNIKGVEAQLQLKVKLERILGSIDRALRAIDNNPQLLDPNYRRSQEDHDEGEGLREITAGTEEPAGGPAPDPDRDGGEPQATDAARKRAGALGLDLSGVRGTGSGGRILLRDVEKAAKGWSS